MGLYFFKVYVEDLNGNINFTELRNITIKNYPPNITASLPNNQTIVLYENQTLELWINYSDMDNESLNVTWYSDEERLGSGFISDCFLVNSSNQSYCSYKSVLNWTANFSTAGNRTFKVVVDDNSQNDSVVWNITIINVNRQPELINDFPTKDWWYEIINNSTGLKNNVSYNLSNYFTDPDNDNLAFYFILMEGNNSYNLSTINQSNYSVFIQQTIFIINSSSGYKGNATLQFEATDGNLSAKSNNITLFVLDDYDLDGHKAEALGGDDCNDNDNSKWIGRSCTRSGYTGSTYDANCACSGGTAIVERPSSSGGGGGGGGGSSSVTLTIKRSKETRYFSKALADVKYTVPLKKDVVPVQSFSFKTNKIVKGFTIEFQNTSDEKELKVPVPYATYNLFKVNLNKVTDADLKEVQFVVKVKKLWLNQNNYRSVVVKRYNKV
jgi:hypothetical protein